MLTYGPALLAFGGQASPFKLRGSSLSFKCCWSIFGVRCLPLDIQRKKDGRRKRKQWLVETVEDNAL